MGDSSTTIYAKDQLAPSLEAATLRMIGGNGSIAPAQEGATITNGTLYFGDIDSDATACGSSTLDLAGDCDQTDELPQLALDASIAEVTSIQLDLTVSTAGPKTFTISVSSD